MRATNLSACLVLLCALGGCDRMGDGGNDFAISTQHDEFSGDVTIASKTFHNGEGSTAQVKLRCLKNGAAATNAVAGMFEAFASILAGAALGAKTGCPQGYSCNVAMEAVFFSADAPAALVVQRLDDSVPNLVTFLAKDLRTNQVQRYSTFLESSGSTYYNNAVRVPVPTGGNQLVRWLYRFDLQQHGEPVDISLDYSAPNLRSFIEQCNALSSSQPAAPAPAAASPTNPAPHELPAPPPSPTPTSPPNDDSTLPLPPSDQADLRLAFNVAFDGNGVQIVDGQSFQFSPVRLVALGQDNYALIAEGRWSDKDGDTACNACHGRLKIIYLAKTASGFSIKAPQVERIIEGNSWGNPPDWEVTHVDGLPAVTAMEGWQMEEGATECWIGVYRLTPDRIVLDEDAERMAKSIDKYSNCQLRD